MTRPTSGGLIHRLVVAFAICLALLAGAVPSNAQVTAVFVGAATVRTTIPVKAFIYPKVLADAIRQPVADVISIAILSSETFDSRKIDPGSLTLLALELNLMGTSNKASCQEKDVDGDGRADLLCQFELAHVPIKSGISMSVLEGQTTDGIGIRAQVPVNIVPDHTSKDPDGASTSAEAPR